MQQRWDGTYPDWAAHLLVSILGYDLVRVVDLRQNRGVGVQSPNTGTRSAAVLYRTATQSSLVLQRQL